jgi:hypothetical protein
MAFPGLRRQSVRCVLAVLALCCAAPVVAHAQSATPAPSAQDLVKTVELPEDGLNIDLGAIVRLRPSHIGANAASLDVVPYVDGQWGKDLHFSLDDGVQYTALTWGRLKIGPDAEYRQPYNDKLPPRTPRTADAIELGGFAKVDLTYGELDVRFRKAIDGYDGYSGDASLGTLLPITRKWFVGLQARLGWADNKFSLSAFGRQPIPGMPPPTRGSIGDFYTAGAQGALIWLWSPRTRLIVSLSDDQILRPSRVRSGADTRNLTAFYIGAARRFTWFAKGS